MRSQTDGVIGVSAPHEGGCSCQDVRTWLKLGTPARKDFIVRAREFVAGEKGLAMMIDPLLEILATMLREFTGLTKQVLVIVRGEPVCRRLMSTPGVGPVTANRRRTQPSRRYRWSQPEEANLKSSNNPRRRKQSSPGDDGQGDPVKSPKPKGASPEGRETDWDASLF